MKKLIFPLLLAFMLGTLPSAAQVNVPTAIAEQFKQQYPTAVALHWEYRESALVAMFQKEGSLMKAFYESNGEWRETRTRTTVAHLPTGVREFITDNYQDADITYAGIVETKEQLVYRIESELRDRVVIKIMTAQGQLLQEEWISYSLNSASVVPTLPKTNLKLITEEQLPKL